MKRIVLASLALLFALGTLASEPDYSEWNAILAKHYDPSRGMDYRALKANRAPLDRLRAEMARVDVDKLTRDEQLAFWLNLYNISVVGIVIDYYPVDSIRDISTDPIVRLNVFKRDLVPFAGKTISLDEIEHVRIRERFRDPRIHFAINCAARSCPPMARQAFRGVRIGEQLDELARAFIQRHVRIDRRENETIVRTTKIMDWFKDDFDKWGGGSISFLRKYLPAERQRRLAGKIDVKYDDYDWTLNDWKR